MTTDVERKVPGWMIAATAALVVATTIPASESAAQRGTHALVSLLWLILGAAWSVLAALGRVPVALGRGERLLGGLALLLVLGTWLRAETADARATLNMLWQWGAWLVAWLLVRQIFRSAVPLHSLLTVVLALIVAQAGFGGYQRYVQMPHARQAYQSDPETILRGQGIPVEPGNIHRVAFESRLAGQEPTGTFQHPNTLAGMAAIGVALVAGIAGGMFGQRRPVNTANGQRALASYSVVVGLAGIFVLLGATVVWTGSRSGQLATALGLLLGLLLPGLIVGSPSPWWRLISSRGTLVLGAIGVAVVSLAGGWGWMSEAAWKSMAIRVEYWGATLGMIGDQPLWGCGLGNFQDYYQFYRPAAASEVVADPHNAPLEIAATAGIPALLMGGLFLFDWARRVVPRRIVSWNQSGSAAGPSSDSDSTMARWVYGGALLGVLVGMLSGALRLRMPSIAFILVGLPLGMTTVLLLGRQWLRERAWGGSLAAIAALLIHLQVSGGIQYGGFAIVLWVLLAVTGNLAEPIADPSSLLSRLVLMGILLVAPLAAYATMFRPVHRSETLAARAALAADLGASVEALELARSAARIDPWSGAMARKWLEIAWSVEELAASRASVEERVEAEREALRRSPRSAALRGWLGNAHFARYRGTGRDEDLQRAIEHYRNVTRIYPHAAVAWAQLAYALSQQPARAEEANIAATEARRLDDLQLHAEQKLASQPLFDAPAVQRSAAELIARLGKT